MLSEGIIAGTVQIPPDSNPIILQKDAQSIGGYPKIGILNANERSLIAQKPASSELRFTFIMGDGIQFFTTYLVAYW